MSWLDKKYKDQLGEQKFPEAMKKRGWESMQGLLDTEMPASGAEVATATTGTLYWVGVAAVIAVIVGLPFFIKFQPEAKQDISQPSIPESQIEHNIANQEREPEQQFYKVDEVYEGLNELSKGINQNSGSAEELDLNKSDAQVASQSEKATPAKVEVEAITPEPKSVEDVPGEAVVAVETKRMDEKIISDNSADPSETTETLNKTEKTESSEDLILAGVLAEAPVEEEVVEEVLDDIAEQNIVVEAQKEAEVLSTEETDENQLIIEESTEIEEFNQSEELLSTEEKETVTVGVEKTSIEKSVEVEEAEETLNESLAKAEDILEEKSISNQKAAHLAFLEADDQAPMPDLMTFSKERFAISLWGGYLYTNKVMSGDKDYIEQRKAAEKPIYTTPTGIALDYFVDKNWTVGTGVGWAEYGENVDYTIYNVTSSFDSVSFDGRNDSPSNYPNIVSIDSTRVIDTVNQGHWNYNLVYRSDDSTANSYSGKNTFRYIEVPLTIGYRFGNGRLKPWVKAGVILGLPVEASYTYPQAGSGLFSQESGTTKLSSVQYSGLLQVGADIFITRTLSLRGNLLGTYQLNPMLKTENLSQRYYRVGATVGLSYNL